MGPRLFEVVFSSVLAVVGVSAEEKRRDLTPVPSPTVSPRLAPVTKQKLRKRVSRRPAVQSTSPPSPSPSPTKYPAPAQLLRPPH